MHLEEDSTLIMKEGDKVIVWNHDKLYQYIRYFIGFTKANEVVAENDTGKVRIWNNYEEIKP